MIFSGVATRSLARYLVGQLALAPETVETTDDGVPVYKPPDVP